MPAQLEPRPSPTEEHFYVNPGIGAERSPQNPHHANISPIEFERSTDVSHITTNRKECAFVYCRPSDTNVSHRVLARSY